MVFKNIAWGMTILAVGFQMVVAAATISVLTFHPSILSDFEEASGAGAPLEVTCKVVKDVQDVDWNIPDRSLT